jgi:gamma-glutamyltranspeptidase/glutathione hydrolase
MSRSHAVSNDPIAEQAAQDHLLSGGSAVGAAVTGFFAAAGAYSGVLLSPVTILVGGIGSGVRAFDGRLRQPGLGTKRPRGFTEEEPIPEAARIAVPTAVTACVVALAYDGGQKLRTVLKQGIARAERCGAEDRVELLRRIAAAGAVAMTEPAFMRPLLAVAGLTEGGLVTASDLTTVPEVDHPAAETALGDGTVHEAPWAAEPGDPELLAALELGCSVLAVDPRGVFAAIAYRRVSAGFPIDGLDLEAPLVAVPVERGVTRVSPGAPLAAPAPLCIRRDVSGALVEVAALPGAVRLEPGGMEKASLRLQRDLRTLEVRVPSA